MSIPLSRGFTRFTYLVGLRPRIMHIGGASYPATLKRGIEGVPLLGAKQNFAPSEGEKWELISIVERPLALVLAYISNNVQEPLSNTNQWFLWEPKIEAYLGASLQEGSEAPPLPSLPPPARPAPKRKRGRGRGPTEPAWSINAQSRAQAISHGETKAASALEWLAQAGYLPKE